MVHVSIQTLIDLFKESLGFEAAEKIIYDAVKNVNLPNKTLYTEEEISSICEFLKGKGGFVRSIATVASSNLSSNLYYQKELAKEKKEKEDLARLSNLLEQKVEERTRELKDVQAQMLQTAKMAAIGQLGAGVAHELNNPLGGILGYAQFMLEKIKRPNFGPEDFKACQRYIEFIEREATRCKGIVERLLTFSRRPLLVKYDTVDVQKAIEDAFSLVGHQLKLKNIEVVMDFKPELYNIKGAVNQLQQVFINLILNAEQAMPEGGKMFISAENMPNGYDNSSACVKIEFKDTGSGINEDNIQHIFEPFFTTKAKQKGTGLGLSVSYQIIQEHKGSLSVKSKLGEGTTFVITLPVEEKTTVAAA